MNNWESEHDLVGAYVLDALSPEERESFEVHIHSCAACQNEVAELRVVVDVLALAIEPVEPPIGLRDRVLRAIEEEADSDVSAPAVTSDASAAATPRTQVIDLDARRRTTQRKFAGTGAVLSLAAAVVIAGLGVWNFTLQQKVNTLKTADAFRQDVTAALVGGASVSTISPTSYAPTANAALVQPRAGTSAYLIVRGLPSLPSGKVYQLWLVRGGTPRSAGIISTVSSTPQIVAMSMASTGYTSTAVTVEPGPQGSQRPTGKQLLAGTVKA